MFNKEILTEMFKEKEFSYGNWHLYFYSENDFSIEEQNCIVEILEGVVKISSYATDEETHGRTDLEAEDYIPFERIINISFVKDF